ncbi:MAG: hypothetical protein QXK94_10715 [Candidatus Jordarchaeales archaeon]
MKYVERRCVFIDRSCNIDVDEIPLEVCSLCIDAWKFSEGRTTVKRAVEVSRSVGMAKPAYRGEAEVKRSLTESLTELDKLFQEDKLTIEEYINRRREIVNSNLGGSESSGSKPSVGWVGLAVLNRGNVELTYPEGFRLPEGFRASAKHLYELSRAVGSNFTISTPTFNLQCLGTKNGRLITLLAPPYMKLEEHEGLVDAASSILKGSENMEEAIQKLYEEVLRVKLLLPTR